MNRSRIDDRNTQLTAPKRCTASFGPCAGPDRSEDRRNDAIPID